MKKLSELFWEIWMQNKNYLNDNVALYGEIRELEGKLEVAEEHSSEGYRIEKIKSRLDEIQKILFGDITGLVDEIHLKQTCGACPEQYDAFHGGKQVGYLRLRHGHFTVDYPDSGGETIYTASPDGDGIFESHEREKYLSAAKIAIASKLITSK